MENQKVIHSLIELRSTLEDSLGTDDLKSIVYDGTACGAWIGYIAEDDSEIYEDPPPENASGIILGSIVEGSDAEVGPYHLRFPFGLTEFWNTLNEIEDEAGYLWDEANRDEEEEEEGGLNS